MNENVHGEQNHFIAVDQPGIYRIKIQGRLNQRWNKRFDEMEMSVEANPAGIPITTLTGTVTDQAALHGLVARIRDLGLPLILLELIDSIDQGG